MNKRNAVKKLNRDKAHRKAMINNMVTSLFQSERIKTTAAKAKVVRSFAEKLITIAKKNLKEGLSKEVILSNKREVFRRIKDREVAVKLFEDIAIRFANRNGGYTRIIRLVNRASDNSEVVYLELLEKKSKEQLEQEYEQRIQRWEDQTEKNREKAKAKKEAGKPKKEKAPAVASH